MRAVGGDIANSQTRQVTTIASLVAELNLRFEVLCLWANSSHTVITIATNTSSRSVLSIEFGNFISSLHILCELDKQITSIILEWSCEIYRHGALSTIQRTIIQSIHIIGVDKSSITERSIIHLHQLHYEVSITPTVSSW